MYGRCAAAEPDDLEPALLIRSNATRSRQESRTASQGGTFVALTPHFEVSAIYVASVQRQAAAFEPALELDPPTLEGLARPYSARWHPGELPLEVHRAVVRRAGAEALVRFERQGATHGLGPIIRPLAELVRTLTRVPAEALLQAVPVAAQLGVRGLHLHWDQQRRELTIRYPVEIEEVIAVCAWRGILEGVFELGRLPPPALEVRFEPSSSLLTFALLGRG